MTTIDRTAYPRFRATLTPTEPHDHFTFNQLVANCVMLQNVLDMSQALRELIGEGYPVTIKAVQGLSAYPHGHVQRYGEYDMDVNDIPPPLLRMS